MDERTPTPAEVIKGNERITRGNAPTPRPLDFGEVAFRIPTEHWPALVRRWPELEHHDATVREAAWRKFRTLPEARPYLVVRDPLRVRRAARGGRR